MHLTGFELASRTPLRRSRTFLQLLTDFVRPTDEVTVLYLVEGPPPALFVEHHNEM
jgi:hypothetical protein